MTDACRTTAGLLVTPAACRARRDASPVDAHYEHALSIADLSPLVVLPPHSSCAGSAISRLVTCAMTLQFCGPLQTILTRVVLRRLTLSNSLKLLENLQLLDVDLVQRGQCFVIGFGA